MCSPVDQVLLRAKLFPPVDKVYLRREIRQIQRILKGRVTAAHDRDTHPPEKRTVTGRAVGNTHPEERLLPRNLQFARCRAHGQDHAFRRIYAPLSRHALFRRPKIRLDRLFGDPFHTEARCLLPQIFGKFRA